MFFLLPMDGSDSLSTTSESGYILQNNTSSLWYKEERVWHNVNCVAMTMIRLLKWS